MKKMFVVGCVCYFFLFNISFSELKESKLNDEMNSVIGLTIDGSSTTTFPNKESRTKCQINFVSKYTEGILNGTNPVLKDGLIPVTIDNNGVVELGNM